MAVIVTMYFVMVFDGHIWCFRMVHSMHDLGTLYIVYRVVIREAFAYIVTCILSGSNIVLALHLLHFTILCTRGLYFIAIHKGLGLCV